MGLIYLLVLVWYVQKMTSTKIVMARDTIGMWNAYITLQAQLHDMHTKYKKKKCIQNLNK